MDGLKPKRCAVAIGVDRVEGLPHLKAAASGAEDFAKWAENQNIEVSLLTDRNGASVTLADIKKAIRQFVDQKVFSQLIVFFSGHGLLKAPDCELWLLSGAPTDPTEAVNVSPSIFLARNVGIPHIVFVSDACRSKPETVRFNQMDGAVIFPNEKPKAPRPEVDVFYATLPGDPALEVSSPDSTRCFCGLFTDHILQGLNGQIPEVIIEQNGNKVTSWTMKPYLVRAVPAAASKINISLSQDPEIRVESHPPKYLAVLPPEIELASVVSEEHDQRVSLREIVQSLAETRFTQGQVVNSTVSDGIRRTAEQSYLAKEIDRLASVGGKESSETRTGFTIIGSAVKRAYVTGSTCDLFWENDAVQVRIHENYPENHVAKSIVLEFADGLGVPLAVLPGFIGTVVVEDNRVMNVSYIPSRNSHQYTEYKVKADRIDRRRAFAATAARNGLFRFPNGLESFEAAEYLSLFKAVDPTLGLYAAYAYMQSGDLDEIASLYKYMSSEQHPVLFDVALLAKKLPPPRRFAGVRISPFCPMLTQGWAWFNLFESKLPSVIRRMSKHLIPGLWTTFDNEGTKLLVAAIKKGQII